MSVIKQHKSLLAIPLALLMILAMVILPLPPILLDTFFTFNIVLAVIVLLVSTTASKPLHFSSFPTVLLIATLMRLTLNVASTRVVLLDGHEGSHAAGQVIQSFGEVVVGGNYVVGMVVFVILMIINFVVITKGGERISEVSARFTLDALPGKQMAIDADLNAGLIDQNAARERRKEIANEADFYGSMDGASKFVRGDAIAGLLILVINIIGGISIGIFSHGMPAAEAFQTFALLTIGDGLVAQIPSLLLATAAAVIVTRVNDSDSDIAAIVSSQLLSKPVVIDMVAGIMVILAIVPGMPTLAFGSFAVILFVVSWRQRQFERQATTIEQARHISEDLLEDKEEVLDWTKLPVTSTLTLNLGIRLVHLVDVKKKEPLTKRIRGVRKNLSELVGFILPEVSIRDDMHLKPHQYSISLKGAVIEKGEIEPDCIMAIATGRTFSQIDGILGTDPAYSLPAVWIKPELKGRALNLGYQVIDEATVVATHVSKIMKTQLAELFNYDDVDVVQQRLQSMSPKLAEAMQEAVPQNLQLKVFRQLLIDQVPISDIKTIATAMIESCEKQNDPIMIASDIRIALRRSLVSMISGQNDSLSVYVLTEQMNKMLLDSFNAAMSSGITQIDSIPIDNNLLEQFRDNLPVIRDQFKQQGLPAVLVVPPQLRPLLSRYARTFAYGLAVLSMNEIPQEYDLKVIGQLG